MKHYLSMPSIDLKSFSQDFEAFKDSGIKLPPPCSFEFQGNYVEYIPRKKMVAVFTVQEKFTGPLGILQGGMLVAFIDDTIGPLSFAVAKAPIVTTSLNINYVRSVRVNEKIIIIAEVITRSPVSIFFEVKVYDEREKLVATLTSQNLIIKR